MIAPAIPERATGSTARLDGLPARCAEGEHRLAVAVWHGRDHVPRDRDDRGQDHDREDDPGVRAGGAVDQRSNAHHVEDPRRIVGRQPVGAKADRHSGIDQAAQRRNAGAELLIGNGVVDDRATRLTHHGDIAVIDPNGVSDRGVAVEHPEVGHDGDQRFAEQLTAGDGLGLGFQHMRVERHAVIAGQRGAGLEHLGRAALRRRGRHHETQAAGSAAMQRGEDVPAERGIGRRRDHRCAVEQRLQMRRHDIPGERQRVEHRNVDHRARHIGADPGGFIGIEDDRQPSRIVDGRIEEIVAQHGDAALQRLHREQQRAQVEKPRRDRRVGERRIGVKQPDFQRHAFVAAAEERLAGMGMGVDEAGQDQLAAGLDDHRVRRRGDGPADRGNAQVDDEQVAVRRRRTAFQGDEQRIAEQRRRHVGASILPGAPPGSQA